MDLAVTPGYRALREQAAWIDLSARGKIRMSGDDRARLLHAMCTNHIEQLKPGEGCYAFFFEDHLLLDTEPEARATVLDHLDRYIIADDVTLEDVTEQWSTIAVEGPLAKLDLPLFCWKQEGARILARLNSTGSNGYFILSPRGETLDLPFPQATAEDARIVRIENGRPRFGDEITDRNLVAETDQLHGVHFSKGCYLGQEIVERVRSQAHIHRILRRLVIDTAEPPPKGYKNDHAEIASAVFSPALGKTVALAYVRTQFAEPGSEFRIGEATARVG
jgi:folate-binding protein YgfZ